MKFGGTSVGTPDAMRQVISIVQTEKPLWKNLIMVTSAFSRVTDTLLAMTLQVNKDQSGFLEGSANNLVRRHEEIADTLISDEILHQTEADRPQPRLDRFTGKGMATAVGRVRPDPLFDIKMVVLSHNTIRGAAGSSIYHGEFLVKLGFLSK
jgi:aspartokinase